MRGRPGPLFVVLTRFRGLVRGRRLRLFHRLRDEGVVAMWQSVTALVSVEGWRKAADVDAFADSPFVPAGLPG